MLMLHVSNWHSIVSIGWSGRGKIPPRHRNGDHQPRLPIRPRQFNTISTMAVAIICSHSHLYHWSAEVAVAVAAEAVALPTEALRWFEANCSSTTT